MNTRNNFSGENDPFINNPSFPLVHSVEMPRDDPSYDATPEVDDYMARLHPDEAIEFRDVVVSDPLARVTELIEMYEKDADLSETSGERATYDSLIVRRDQILRDTV